MLGFKVKEMPNEIAKLDLFKFIVKTVSPEFDNRIRVNALISLYLMC